MSQAELTSDPQAVATGLVPLLKEYASKLVEIGTNARRMQRLYAKALLTKQQVEAVKQGLATPGAATILRSAQDAQISFASLPLGLYRILWTSNLAAPFWNTLTNNVPGTNGITQVTDPGALNSQPRRFYRVQTPP